MIAVPECLEIRHFLMQALLSNHSDAVFRPESLAGTRTGLLALS